MKTGYTIPVAGVIAGMPRLAPVAMVASAMISLSLLAGCDRGESRAAAGGPAATTKLLPQPRPLPDFALTERSGDEVTLKTLAGRVWIANFIFTRCAGQCPTMSVNMNRLQKELADLPEVRFVSFSVDPEHDQPKRLEQYARSYGADSQRWLFLTGDREAVHRLCEKGFLLAVKKNDDPATSAVEPIAHSGKFVLIDQQGRLRGYYDGSEQREMNLLKADVQRLLREEPSP